MTYHLWRRAAVVGGAAASRGAVPGWRRSGGGGRRGRRWPVMVCAVWRSQWAGSRRRIRRRGRRPFLRRPFFLYLFLN